MCFISLFCFLWKTNVHHSATGQDCASNPTGGDLSLLAPCTHEEADNRMMMHNTAVYEGHRHVRHCDENMKYIYSLRVYVLCFEFLF